MLIFRPYDIGDRIIIADNPGGSIEGAANSWFVEGKRLNILLKKEKINTRVSAFPHSFKFGCLYQQIFHCSLQH